MIMLARAALPSTVEFFFISGYTFGALISFLLPKLTEHSLGTCRLNQSSEDCGKHLAKENIKFSFGLLSLIGLIPMWV
jgi:hypothetical protein